MFELLAPSPENHGHLGMIPPDVHIIFDHHSTGISNEVTTVFSSPDANHGAGIFAYKTGLQN